MLRRWVWVKIMDQGDRLSDDRGMYPRKSRHLTVILCPGSKTVSGPRRAKRHLPTQGEASKPLLVFCMASSFSHRVGGRLVRDGEASFTWCWIHHSEDPNFGDPTNQFVGVNDSKWLKQKSIKKWPVAIDCLWLLWISYLYLSNNPLSISSIIIYYLTSIPINIYKLSRLPPMLPSICRVVARRRESEHLYHAASLRWGRLMRHSWNLVWLQVRMWGKIYGSILDHT